MGALVGRGVVAQAGGVRDVVRHPVLVGGVDHAAAAGTAVGWLPAVLLGAGSVVEIIAVTMQRWRGEASHFNYGSSFDEAVWSTMGNVVLLVALALTVFLVWSLVRFEGSPAARIAVVVGLLAMEVSGYIGFGMADKGEKAVEATGQVPETVKFGAEGSAKLAHAVGMHGLQLLGLLAIGLAIGSVARRTQIKIMVLAAAGYAAVFGGVAATAYAGRAWTSPTAAMAALIAAGALAVMVAAAATVTRLSPARADVVK
ncbi:hypothetical protein Prum_086640 [Phytohabitans rumicis]|uniref:Uncharacterized protein n=1 Tax=Phytohabitans rumicis TaxID=1076125 RepID=A0A6V8LCR9_9ACTN|nr:hypothetical protein Prum_086640 [Phytohabitans rumicis]